MNKAEDESEVEEIRFFALTERIGRLRYLAYGIGLSLLVAVPVLAGITLTLRGAAFLGTPIALLCYAFTVVMSIVFMVRRLHDMDASGWWALLVIVPILNVILAIALIVWPGTSDINRFGLQPPPNSGWVIAGALTYPALFVAGCTAAMLAPAYQDHMMRAQMTTSLEILPPLENEVIVYRKTNGKWPTKSEDVPLPFPPPGGMIQSINIEQDGSIHLIYGGPRQINGKSVYMTPHVDTDGSFSWGCATNLDARYLTDQLRAECGPVVE